MSCSYFTTLWIYTILKRAPKCLDDAKNFTTLWIYTILKPFFMYLVPDLFYYLMDLHYSQTLANVSNFS